MSTTFDAVSGAFRCRPEHKPVAVAVPIQGISVTQLMGELATITRMPTYQLALPFSATAARQQSHIACVTGTN